MPRSRTPIQPAFRDHLPYMIVIVELDEQKGAPEPDDGLRVTGNLVTPEGALAGPEMIARVGIGSRMRMVFRQVGEGFALPMWTPDDGRRRVRQAVALSRVAAASANHFSTSCRWILPVVERGSSA